MENPFEELFGTLNKNKMALEKKYPNISKYPASVQECLRLGEELNKKLEKLSKTK
jgi:hypothetical protein